MKLKSVAECESAHEERGGGGEGEKEGEKTHLQSKTGQQKKRKSVRDQYDTPGGLAVVRRYSGEAKGPMALS